MYSASLLDKHQTRIHGDLAPIRVVHIITGLATGGAVMMLYKLLRHTDNSRFEHIVVSLRNHQTFVRHEIESLGVPIHTIGLEEGQLSLSGLVRLSKLVRKLEPKIIQGWMYHANVASCLSQLSLRRRVPIVWNVRHSAHSLRHEKKLTVSLMLSGSLLSRMTSRIIYNSQVSARQHEALRYAASRTQVIPNGFDCEHFKPSAEARGHLRNSLGIRKDDLAIGLFGRYHPMKDHETFLEAARIISKRFENARFVLAGLEIDASNRKLAESIQSRALTNRVHLLGERKDMPTLMAGMDIVCSSSAWGEAFSNVIGEAMSCGVPCVVTAVGDANWIVGNTGQVTPPKNAAALAEACVRLIEAGQENLFRLGNAARQRLIENFSIKEVVHAYEALYARTVGLECSGERQ